MIEFNMGFIMSLTIQEKQELKLKVDSLELKNTEQIKNQMMVRRGSLKEQFEENKNHLDKQIVDKEQLISSMNK